MGDFPAFLFGGFGGADVESAVNLHGVDGDDFAAEPARQFESQG